MKIIKAYPPNWTELTKHFPIKGRQGILYAWGDRLYNPSGVVVTPWIRAHEEVHGRRQDGLEGDETMSVLRWWDNYVAYEDFRYKEELLAHRREWREYVDKMGDVNGYYLDAVAKRLASPLYGNMTTFEKARKAIEED